MSIPARIWKNKPEFPQFDHKRGSLFVANAIELLYSLRENSVDIVFLDPPFNLGKAYGNNINDNKIEIEYKYFITQILIRSYEVLKPGGALYLYHIPKWSIEFAALLQNMMIFQHWISISMKNGFMRGKGLYPAHYALLFYTKGNAKRLKRPKIPAQICRSCGEYAKDYGGYKKFIKKGINLSDVWDDLSPVRHKKTKHRKANELPIELTDRILKISGYKNGILLDPFAGTCTSLISAIKANMYFIGSDINKKSISILRERINEMGRE